MKGVPLIVFCWVLVVVLLVSVVAVLSGHFFGIPRGKEKLKPKAGVDLVSVGSTPLTDESSVDETGEGTGKNQERHQLTPEEMKKLMVESSQATTQNAPLPPGYENEDGPGEGFDPSQIPAGIVFDLRDEIQGRYGDANINVTNQTGGIVKEGEASIKVELDPCLEIDKVGFRPWALSWMVQEDKPGLFKPNIFPKAIEKVFGDGFDIPRMLPDNNFICYIPIRVKKGTPSLDSGPVLVTLYAKAKGQGWSQVDLEKIWF